MFWDHHIYDIYFGSKRWNLDFCSSSTLFATFASNRLPYVTLAEEVTDAESHCQDIVPNGSLRIEAHPFWFDVRKPNSQLTKWAKIPDRSSSEAFPTFSNRSLSWTFHARFKHHQGIAFLVAKFTLVSCGTRFEVPTLENSGPWPGEETKSQLEDHKRNKVFQHIDMLATSLQEMYEEKLLLEKNSKTQRIPDDGVFNPESSDRPRQSVGCRASRQPVRRATGFTTISKGNVWFAFASHLRKSQIKNIGWMNSSPYQRCFAIFPPNLGEMILFNLGYYVKIRSQNTFKPMIFLFPFGGICDRSLEGR